MTTPTLAEQIDELARLMEKAKAENWGMGSPLSDYLIRHAGEILASLQHLAAIEAVKVPEPVAYLQTVSNPGEPDRLLLSITCDRSLHRQLKTGGTYTRKPLYTHPPAQRDGMLRAAEICDKVGARLSAGAGYACKIAAEEIRNSA